MAEQYDWEKGLLLNAPVFPKSTVEYQSFLDSGDFSALEDVLMEHLEMAPEDIAWYFPAYRTFIRKHDESRVSAFLSLHIDTLKECHDLSSEIILLQAILDLWPECTCARTGLLDHLKAMYVDSSHFETFTQHLQVSGNKGGVERLRQLELWLRYDVGRIVYIPSKGSAQIREVNPKLGVVRLLMKNGEKMSLRIDEVERLSRSLAKDHFLARLYLETDVLRKIAGDDPGELLRLFFVSIKREVVLSELRKMLADIVPDSDWSRWWTRARKDSRLIVGSERKPTLHWIDSVEEGSAVILDAFRSAGIREKNMHRDPGKWLWIWERVLLMRRCTPFTVILLSLLN